MSAPLEKVAGAVVLTLAGARLARLVTRDWIGEWYLVAPLTRRAARAAGRQMRRRAQRRGLEPAAVREAVRAEEALVGERSHSAATPAGRLVTMLDCPFCVGFWLGGGLLAGEAATRALAARRPRSAATRAVRGGWSLGAAALAMNYVVGHLSSRID